MEKVGKEGVITVEEGKGLENELDVVEGMQFDRGYLSPYFITNQENMSVEHRKPIHCCWLTRKSLTFVNCCHYWKLLLKQASHWLSLLKTLKAKPWQLWLLTTCAASLK